MRYLAVLIAVLLLCAPSLANAQSTDTPTPTATQTPSITPTSTSTYTPSPDVRVFITLPPSTPGNPGQGAEVDLRIDAGQIALFMGELVVIGVLLFLSFLVLRQGAQ